jgi:hypothetical protein
MEKEQRQKRMNDLVVVKDLEELVKLKKKIRNDLIKEGFDPDDSADYVDESW